MGSPGRRDGVADLGQGDMKDHAAFFSIGHMDAPAVGGDDLVADGQAQVCGRLVFACLLRWRKGLKHGLNFCLRNVSALVSPWPLVTNTYVDAVLVWRTGGNVDDLALR